MGNMLLAFHKPFGVLSQFTPEPGSKWVTLADYRFPKTVYPLGRLDADSEGLLLLSDESGLNTRLLDPKQRHERTYWAQVEGIPTQSSLAPLREGILIQGHRTLPSEASVLDPQPTLPERQPPIRFRKEVPTCWIQLRLVEGKNRQVRRMTAAIGHPTLRLIRTAIGTFELNDLAPGSWRELSEGERKLIFLPTKRRG